MTNFYNYSIILCLMAVHCESHHLMIYIRIVHRWAIVFQFVVEAFFREITTIYATSLN